jgi:hypothetical protein
MEMMTTEQLMEEVGSLLQHLDQHFERATVAKMLSIALVWHLTEIQDTEASIEAANYLGASFKKLFSVEKDATVH